MTIELNKIFNETNLETMKRIPDNFIDCIVTSPPYWGLRDYEHPDQIGLERTPEEYIKKMVIVFNECQRILKSTGTLWLNLGDSYYGVKSKGYSFDLTGTKQATNQGTLYQKNKAPDLKHPILKQKDLVGIPWRVAFALQAEGWYLRQDIIWHKPSVMPESVTDRCTKSHEYVFLLTKNKKYYFDNEAIKEDAKPDKSIRNRDETKLNNTPGRRKMTGLKVNNYEKRNKRSVWAVSTAQSTEEHFATFPEKLIIPMILAGCPENGIIYDPFMGSGTTALVALKLNRNYIGSEISEKFCNIAGKRITPVKEQGLMFR